MSVRITGEHAQKISKMAEEFTGKAFREAQIGNDQGRGARVISGHTMHTWYGEPRSAAAYYIGGMLGWARATGSMIPDDVVEFCRPMRELISQSAKLQGWQAKGEAEGKAHAEVRASN